MLFVYTGEYSVDCLRDTEFNKSMKLEEEAHLNKLVELKDYIKAIYPLLNFDILIIYINKYNEEIFIQKENMFIVNVNIPINSDEINRKNITEKIKPLFF